MQEIKIADQLTRIVEKEKEAEILPFLKTLDDAGKKELTPTLKKLFKTYNSYYEDGNTYRQKWTDKQRHILAKAGFVCFNRKDFEQNNSFVLDKATLDPILPWYCPKWFGDMINGYGAQDFVPYFLNYDWYTELVDQGHVNPDPVLLAKLLPPIIFTYKGRENTFTPEKLHLRTDTLSEHIWYIFDHESGINWSDRYLRLTEATEDGYWIDEFKKLSQTGKLDRGRLLKEALGATNKSFNKTLSGWFADLLVALKPNTDELLELQSPLFGALSSPHSKVVNMALKYLKDIATLPQFGIDDLYSYAPMLLTAEARSTVTTALMIMDTLAKKHPDQRLDIAIKATDALMHQDNALQVRAAKLIQKYGDPASEELRAALSVYSGAVLFDAKQILVPFFEAEPEQGTAPEEHVAIEPSGDKLMPISVPQTFDEFVYLASQVFDHNEEYHFDLLPAGLLRFHSQMTAEHIDKLLPAFQRAFSKLVSDYITGMGYLEHMLATFFIDYGLILLKKFPVEAKPISLLRSSFEQKEKEKKQRSSWYQPRSFGTIRTWGVYSHSPAYIPHKQLLACAYYLLEQDIALPLVSTPTHQPCLVSAATLIRRLAIYQKAQLSPNITDLQVAIARCVIEDADEAKLLTTKLLHGELQQLMAFVLGSDEQPQKHFKLKAAWLAAAMRRSPSGPGEWTAFTDLTDEYLTGNFNWTSRIEPYTYKDWDYNTQKQIDKHATRAKLTVHFTKREKPEPLLKGFLQRILPGDKERLSSIYDDIQIKYQYASAEEYDIKRHLNLMPTQPEPWLAQIIDKTLTGPDFSEESSKRLMLATLEFLLTYPGDHGPMAHLIIATCMLCSDKTMRVYAAELWIKGVAEGTLSSQKIGNIIGIHEKIALAPLKRFTDLIISNMHRISTKHDRELEVLLSSAIVPLAKEPINNLKKLLDIYGEVLSVNGTKKLDDAVAAQLSTWEEQSNLSATIKKIYKITEHQ